MQHICPHVGKGRQKTDNQAPEDGRPTDVNKKTVPGLIAKPGTPCDSPAGGAVAPNGVPWYFEGGNGSRGR